MQPSPVQIRQPGKAGFWVGAILLVVGVFGGFGLILVGALDIVRGVVDAPSVGIGESEELQLNAQRYELYLFSESGGALPADPEVTVESTSGEDVQVGPPTPGADTGTSAFRSIGTFTIAQAGAYDVAVSDVGGGSSVTVRVGADFNSLVESSSVWIMAGLVVGATGFVAGLIVLFVTARRRSNARRANQAAWAGYAATPPGYPTMGQPPGWGPTGPSGPTGASGGSSPAGPAGPAGGPPAPGVTAFPPAAAPPFVPPTSSSSPSSSPSHQPSVAPHAPQPAPDGPGAVGGPGAGPGAGPDAGPSDAGGPRDPFGG